MPFTTVGADVTLADGLLTVRRLDGRGDGFTLTGSGAVGLGPDDVSDFRYRIEADSLVNPAKVADLPITGSATTEGRITGTRAEFLVTGTLAGDQVAYSDTVAAGTVTAQYAVRVPDFDPDRVDVQTSVDGQQIQVAGQVLPTVNGTVGYTTDLVRFDASGTDALRTLAARGTLRLEDGRQRLTLEQAQVSREGVTVGARARHDGPRHDHAAAGHDRRTAPGQWRRSASTWRAPSASPPMPSRPCASRPTASTSVTCSRWPVRRSRPMAC